MLVTSLQQQQLQQQGQSTDQAVVYLYRFQDSNSKQEVNLIDLDDIPTPPSQKPFLQPNRNMDVINLKLEDLIGGDEQEDDQPFFQPMTSLPSTSASTSKTPNAMLQMDVLDYLNRSNEKHYALMQQVSNTRMNCKKLFYQFM